MEEIVFLGNRGRDNPENPENGYDGKQRRQYAKGDAEKPFALPHPFMTTPAVSTQMILQYILSQKHRHRHTPARMKGAL